MSPRRLLVLLACLSRCACPQLDARAYACLPDGGCEGQGTCRDGYCFTEGSASLALSVAGGTRVPIGACQRVQVSAQPVSDTEVTLSASDEARVSTFDSDSCAVRSNRVTLSVLSDGGTDFGIRALDAGRFVLTASAPGYTDGELELTAVGPPARAVFVNRPLQDPDSGLPDFPLNTCLGPLTLELRDAWGQQVRAGVAVLLAAQPAGLQLFATAGCLGPSVGFVDTLDTQTHFWVKSSTGRRYTVTATLKGATDSQAVALNPLARRGTCVLPGPSVSVSCPVDPPVAKVDQAFVVHSARMSSTDSSSLNLRCLLTAVDMLRCERLGAGGSGDGALIAWQVVEGRDLSVQRVDTTCDAGPVAVPVGVDPSHTLLVPSQVHAGAIVDDDDFAISRLSGGTLVTDSVCSTTLRRSVQLVTHPSFIVQQMPTTLTSGTQGIGIAGSQLALLQYQTDTMQSGLCDRALRLDRRAPNGATLRRGLDSTACETSTITALITAVDPRDAGTVQPFIEVGMGANETEQVLTLSRPVDPTRTLVFPGSFGPPGMGVGETQLLTGSFGVASITAELIDDGGTSANQLRVRRDAAGADAGFTIQLLTFSP